MNLIGLIVSLKVASYSKITAFLESLIINVNKSVPETIEAGLGRARGLLETSGEIWSSIMGWSKRIYDLGNILGRVVPVAGPIIARIFSS